MRTIFFMLMLGLSGVASGTTYYVSSSLGNDANSGTSTAFPWKTMAKVNGQTFVAGDSILLKRGDVWNESLVPPGSGAAGNPITFDAYGTGAPPNLTGYYAVPTTAWVLVTGNAWKAPLPAGYSTINFCLFGSVWGQKVAAVSSNLTAQWDFYLANGFVYVYSVGNPATFYQSPIVPMALSNVPVINVNGESWLTFQHLLVNWFDEYGVYVQGASDHLVFANMEMDSMIPQGTQPLGLYVNEGTPGPGDIKIYNAEAHMNYDGFRFDGVASAITMVNDKAYGNRDGALVDNTGAVTYSYCHFYASSLAVAGSTDVLWTSGTGPTVGAGNVAADTAPAVQAWQRYPAEVTLTVDDIGMTPGADAYYGTTVAPIADTAGVPVGVAITVGYTSTINPLISTIQGWINAGRDVTSHSMSHTYYTNTDALDIQYTGSGSAATLSISNKTLAIAVTGAADSVSYDLTQFQPRGTILGLEQALTATGHFTATENPTCQGPYGTGCSAFTKAALLSQDLADVSSQNVKSAVYAMQLDVTRLTTDEITLSRNWMTSNLTGLPATPVYVYPGGYETTTMQGIAAGVPYSGGRGALKEDLGVKDTYASGFDVQNVTSFGVNPSWMGLTPGALNQKIQALVWKQRVWGVPWGVFWHLNELTESDPVGGTEITNLIQDFESGGATIQTNTGLVNWLTSGTLEAGADGNFYYKSAASSMGLDFRPTASSPVVDAGQNLGAAYQLDINGVNQNSYGSGWEIGAHAYAAYSSYGQTNPPMGSYFSIGGAGQTSAVLSASPMFGFTETNTAPSNFPTVSYGMQRIWDSPPLQWPSVNTAAGVFNFTALDAMLAQDYSNTSCGPPTYPCSNQTQATVQTPAFPPISTTPTQSYQGAFQINSVGYDTSLNPVGVNRYMTVTDAATSSNRSVTATYNGDDQESVVNCKGRADWDAISGNTGTHACANAPVYFLAPQDAGNTLFISFDPTQPVGSQISPNSGLPTLRKTNGESAGWSHADPSIYYRRSGTAILADVVNSTATALVSETTVFDAASCPGFGNPTYNSTIAIGSAGVLTVGDGSDILTFFATTSGITGGAGSQWIIHYVPSANSCAVLNSATGNYWAPCVLSGSCTSVGPAGTVSIGVYIHQVVSSKDGRYSPIFYGTPCPSTCPTGTFTWDWVMQTLTPQCSVSCGGHTGMLVTKFIPNNNPSPNIRAFANPSSFTTILTYPVTLFDAHMSPNNVDENETFPVIVGSQGPAGTWTGPYFNEIFSMQYQGALIGQTSRFGHCFIEGASNENFQAKDCIGVAFPDGKYWMGNMDMLGQLGTDALGNIESQVFLVGPLDIAAAATNTWYVNASTGSDANPCTSSGSPCLTIAHAESLSAAGDTISIAAGTYRLTSGSNGTYASGGGRIAAKDNQLFTGPACVPTSTPCTAILSGSVQLTQGQISGPDGLGNYSATGFTQQGNNSGYSCDPGWAGCNLPEDLYVNGSPYQRLNLGAEAALSAGTWWFNTTTHTIYLPAALTPSFVNANTVEIGVLDTAFDSNGANGITIQNLTVEEFASELQQGGGITPWYNATASSSSGINWTVQNSYLTLNHSAGVRVGFGMQVLNNVSTLNGQFGVGGGPPAGNIPVTSSGVLIQGNTVTFNNYAHVDPGFSAGGMKFGNTANMVVRGNTVSNNLGDGIHFDTNSWNPLIDGNTVANNLDSADTSNANGSGILCEIGEGGCTIRNNVVTFEGQHGSAAIQSSTSRGAEAYCNVVTQTANNNQVLKVNASARGNNTVPPNSGAQIVSTGNWFHHNTVIWNSGQTGATGYFLTDTAGQPNFFSLNTPVDYNMYHAASTSVSQFVYDNNSSGSNTQTTVVNYQRAGADAHGTFDTAYTSGAPTVVITSPTDQSSLLNTVNVTVQATASDGSGITQAQLYVDWVLVETISGVGPFTFAPVTNLGSGTHVIAVMATAASTVKSCNAVTVNPVNNFPTPANGALEVMYTLGRTPPWATSQPGDTTCNYQSPAVGGGHGECYVPSDLNVDGSGTNATWKAWITALATHLNDPTYLQTHAHVKYWEPWNEPDDSAFFHGSIAQLARLTEDVNCIITGRGVIHQSGNGTATACTATPIDPAAKIIMPAAHATSSALLTYGQNELYCNNTAGIPAYELPCPNPANAIAAAVDVVNYHMKPGNTTGNNCPIPTVCTPETAMAMYMNSVHATLQPAELAKPLWDGELSYADAGFVAPYNDPDMAASLMPRLYLSMWSLGISGSAFYSWDVLEGEPAAVQTSYEQAYNWLAGSVLTSPCSATGTVWSCEINKSGTAYLIMWDTSKSCSAGSCTTGNQTVASQWAHQQDMTSASSPSGISGNSVAVGIKPVVLSQ